MFNIVICNNLSFADLRDLHNRGMPVIKTPHVGNMYPNNLAVAKIGIPLLLNDRTIGYKDKNFHPHLIIQSGKYEAIACDKKFTPHNVFQKRVNGYEIGSSVVNIHTAKLRRIFPNTRIETYTEYQQRHISIFTEIVNLLLRNYYQLFGKYVDTNGTIHLIQPSNESSISKDKIFGITNAHEGWLLPNIITILICGICEILDYQTYQSYHLSGPDMVRYIGQLRPTLNDLYDHICKHSSLPIPPHLDYFLIPASEMRFAVHKSQESILNDLIDSYLSTKTNRQNRSSQMQSATEDQKKELIATITRERKAHNNVFAQAVNTCKGIFYDIHSAKYLSQHDLFESSDLYVHPWGIKTPIEEIVHTVKYMKKFLL
ncbi:hypothetical protein ISS03_00165 [Patescibacteria group bacterium]|nr:hypothetical protein [Patescibacteria group bacterium]